MFPAYPWHACTSTHSRTIGGMCRQNFCLVASKQREGQMMIWARSWFCFFPIHLRGWQKSTIVKFLNFSTWHCSWRVMHFSIYKKCKSTFLQCGNSGSCNPSKFFCWKNWACTICIYHLSDLNWFDFCTAWICFCLFAWRGWEKIFWHTLTHLSMHCPVVAVLMVTRSLPLASK